MRSKVNGRVRDARMLRRAVKGRWAKTDDQRQKTLDQLSGILKDPASSERALEIAAEAVDQLNNQEGEEPQP